jgi:hypothetical protein
MSFLSIWVLASLIFLSLAVFGVAIAQQQLPTNQSIPSNGSNMLEHLSNQSIQNDSSNRLDEVYTQCLGIAAKNTCDIMFTN